MVNEEEGHGDVKYGALFKQSGFFKPSSSKSWRKRFFLFNTRTMLLQYWSGEEERIFKVAKAVSGPPRSSVSLLSSNLVVEQGPIERSMFGQKYPIKISNGPAFSGRTLVLATSSPVAREAWMTAIQNSIENLKERQRVNLVQAKIITDTSDPAYNTLENQYMMVKDKEAKVKEMEQKISRLLVQCELMRSKDRKLYNFQERLLLEHRDVEDKLFSLTQEENNPQRRFRFIKINHTQTMFDELPMGIYRHTAPKWVNEKMGKRNNPLNIPESEFHFKYEDPKTMDNVEFPSLTKTANRFLLEKNKDHKLWKLENKQYHPYVTYNTVVNNLDKQYDDSPKTFLNDATGAHEIRTLDDGQDYELKSLREMNIFDFLKSEKKKPYFHLIQRVDRTDADDHKAGDVFPTSKEIGEDIPDHDHEVDILDAASLHQDRYVDMNQAMREYLQGVNATSFYDVEHENRYFVDESGRRF